MKRLLSVLLVVAMMVSGMSLCIGSSAEDLTYNESPNFMALSTGDMSLQTQVYNAPEDAKGVTVWVRITGAIEPFYLYEMKFNIATNAHSGIWSYNHGQDGCRNAMWQITGNGDYLFFIPFEYYTLSHSFIGDDVVKTITNFSIQAVEVTNANKDAKIALMAMFDGKVDSFNTTFVDGSDESTVEGKYNYMNAELSVKATNYQSTEYYDPALGKAEHADEPIDYTEKICTSWQYAYVDSALPNDTAESGQKFEGWMDAAENGFPMIAKGENTLYADYSNTLLPTYTVTFEDGEGNVIGTDTVAEGESAVYRGETPTKPATETTYFAFSGWDKSVMSVTADMTVVAQYVEKDITFVVTYMNGDKLLNSEIVKKNSAATFDPAATAAGVPTKNGNAEEYYEFSGWVDADGKAVDLSKVTSDMTVYAGYTAIPETETYTVTFKNYDGSTLQETTTGVHSYVEYTADAPVKPGDEDYTYNFTGWDVEFADVREDTTVNAVYENIAVPTGHKTGLDLGVQTTIDGNEIKLISSVPYSLDVANPYVTLIIKAEGVDTPATLGGFRMRSRGKKGAALDTGIYDSNSSANYRACKDVFEFAEDGYYYLTIGYYMVNWASTDGFGNISMLSFANGQSNIQASSNTNENLTLDFMYMYEGAAEFTVRYYNEDGSFISAQTFKNPTRSSHQFSFGLLETVDNMYVGEAPVKAEDEIYKYNFAGWADADGNIVDAVYDNIDVYAYFEREIKDPVTITFKNGDETFESYDLPRGFKVDAPAEDPRKASDVEWSYVFRGWNTDASKILATTPDAVEVVDVAAITANDNVTLYAVYERVERLAEVTFMTEDKETEIGKIFVKAGQLLSEIPTAPVKEATAEFTYEFEKWVDAEGNEVVIKDQEEDIVVYAYYKAITNQYTVTFYEEDKTTKLGESTVDYGTAATAPEATKAASEYYTYEFAEWVDANGEVADLTSIKADISVYATYTATYVHPYEGEKIDGWALPAVEYVMVNGIMTGMDGGFKPKTNMSRAMVVTVLYRYMDEPALPEGAKNIFNDVEDGKWYTSAIVWAAHYGVVDGKGNGIFDPNGNVTRQEFAAILYRFSDEIMDEYMGYGRSSLSAFYDRGEIASWAASAVKWAFATADDLDTAGSTAYDKTQYINGKGEKNNKPIMAPKANATRAEVATMLYRYMTGVRITKDEAK